MTGKLLQTQDSFSNLTISALQKTLSLLQPIIQQRNTQVHVSDNQDQEKKAWKLKIQELKQKSLKIKQDLFKQKEESQKQTAKRKVGYPFYNIIIQRVSQLIHKIKNVNNLFANKGRSVVQQTKIIKKITKQESLQKILIDLFKPIEKKSIMHEEETEISSGNLWKKKFLEKVEYKSDKYPYVTEKIIFE